MSNPDPIPPAAPPAVEPGPDPDRSYVLTPEQLEAFDRDGFVGPFRAGTEEEIAAIRAGLEPYLDKPEGPPWAYVTMGVHTESPDLMKLGRDPRIVERVASILGDDVVLWRGWTFTKPAGARATGVHRDGRTDQAWTEYDAAPGKKNPQLSVWVALEPADEENGCLWAAPGTQRIDFEHDEQRPYEPVDYAMYPTKDFLAEYDVESVNLKGLVLTRRRWAVICAGLRAVGWLQRGLRALARVAGGGRKDLKRFRSPPLTGLTRDEQRLFARHTGPNVNRVTPESLRAVPLERPMVPMLCQTGEFYIFREDVIHAAPANESDRRRAAVVLGYAIPSGGIHANRHPVLVRGENRGGLELWEPGGGA